MNSRNHMGEAFPLIEISGTPEIRGQQYGRQAAERIYKGIGHYTSQLEALGLDRKELATVIRDYLPVIEAFDPAYVTEMHGIAAGADIAFEDVMLLNARSEVLKLAANPALRESLIGAGDVDGCTGVIVMPEATEDKVILHAQNWDWKLECAETAIVLRIRRDDGPDILTFTEAGALARSGLNSAGIALTANYLESNLDYQTIGVPLPLIRRKILEQQHLALAFRAAYVTAKSGSNNMMISHRDGMAINFECAPNETFLLHATNGMIVHANHWLSTVALCKLKDIGIASTPDTLYRDIRVRQQLQMHNGSINIKRIKDALLDDFASPWSVCRPPRMNLTSNLSATVATIVIDPTNTSMQVAALPSVNATFTTYGF